MTTYKPFDLEAAKRGEKVQTRDGRPVRIVCWDREDSVFGRPILALVSGGAQELCYSYKLNGAIGNDEEPHNLVMAPTTRKVREVPKIVGMLRGNWCNPANAGKDPYEMIADLCTMLADHFEGEMK